jgi:hypothetical protein
MGAESPFYPDVAGSGRSSGLQIPAPISEAKGVSHAKDFSGRLDLVLQLRRNP